MLPIRSQHDNRGRVCRLEVDEQVFAKRVEGAEAAVARLAERCSRMRKDTAGAEQAVARLEAALGMRREPSTQSVT